MVLDPDAAVIQKMYQVITGDSELQTICGGGVNLHLNFAGQDPEMPYLVHRLESTKVDIGKRDGDYYLDLWDYDTNSDTIWEIKRRLLEILDEQRYDTTEAQIRISNDIFNPIPESTAGIQHYHSRWSLQYFAKEIVGEINSR